MNLTKAIMLQGTGSGVGKSVLVSALCRIFLQDGFRVAPFKAQNMALNSFVTNEGREIGRAQATQAMACKIKPSADMNPILIKPTSDTSAQIIIQGRPLRNMSVYEYKTLKKTVFKKVKASLGRLCKEYEIVVIEGAGSPAEINLRNQDVVNMRIARHIACPVILVGDIDRGGVFASLVGTLQLLPKEEKRLIKGFIINKFRGDKRLLRPGIKFLENYTGIKVLGTIPYYKNIKIPEEDSVPLEEKTRDKTHRPKDARLIEIAVINLPHISNFTDFDALEKEPDVRLRYINDKDRLEAMDVIILPGTKNTIADLGHLRKSGLAEKILFQFHSRLSTLLIGICGGYQMLGERIYDPESIETKKKEIKGLGLLPLVTEFRPEKVLSQVKARDLSSGWEVLGYEIHHGITRLSPEAKPKFEIHTCMQKKVKKRDGAQTEDQRCWGTYIHGIFDNDNFRRHFLNNLRKDKGWPAQGFGTTYDIDGEIDKLAGLVRENINLNLLYNILLKREGAR